MKRIPKWAIPATVAVICCVPLSIPAQEHSQSDQANEANNPLTPKITINFQDQWAPELFGSDEETNAFLLRGLLPHKLFGQPQLFRFTLPVATAPAPGGDVTALGDLNLINLFPFKLGHIEVAVGPQLTIPTATSDATGTDKWQLGAAGLLIAPQQWGMLGGLVTWQASIAGDDDRPEQNNLTVQPLLFYNLPTGWYLRSTAIWNFDLERGHYAIPIGAGIGKVFVRPGGVTINVFAEPQFTIAHDGAGQPKFQVFAGVNLQFPLGH